MALGLAFVLIVYNSLKYKISVPNITSYIKWGSNIVSEMRIPTISLRDHTYYQNFLHINIHDYNSQAYSIS